MPASGVESIGYVVIRGILFIALLLVIGVGGFQHVTLRLLRRRGSRAGLAIADAADRRATGIALAAVVVLLAAVLGRLMVQLDTTAPIGADIPGLAAKTVFHTAWGHAWLVQLAATLLGLGFLTLVWRNGRGKRGAIIAMLILAVTPVLSGHAMATEPFRLLTMVAGSFHVLGASGWLGTLAVLMLAGVPAAQELDGADRGAAVADLVNAFSPAALVCAGLVVVSGIVVTLIHVRSATALWETHYGQLLLIKSGTFGLVTTAGAYNWLMVRPALRYGAGTKRLQRYATLELLIAVVVVVITAVLVATPLPRELGVAAR